MRTDQLPPMNSVITSKRKANAYKISTRLLLPIKAAIGAVCDALNSLKSNLDRPVLKAWRDGLDDVAIADGFKYLQEINFNALRQSCSNEDLKDIESNLLPIIGAAELDSKDAPPDVQKLTRDKNLLDVAKSVIAAEDLKSEIARGNVLVQLINSLEQGVRLRIRSQSQSVIDTISQDLESMWSIATSWRENRQCPPFHTAKFGQGN